MDLFETLKEKLDFEKHVFTYSDSGNEKADVNQVVIVSRLAQTSPNNSANNSDDELAYLKSLECFSIERDGDKKQLDSADITAELFNEKSLNCGNYRGNNSGKKLSEIVQELVNDEADFTGFLFRKSGDLKGYVVLTKEDDKLIVSHLCLTTVLESNREMEEEKALHKVLMYKSLDDFIETRLLNEESGVAAAQNIETDTTAGNFNTTSNFLVILRLAQAVKGGSGSGFLDFSSDIPSYQIRSLFSTSSTKRKSSQAKNNNSEGRNKTNNNVVANTNTAKKSSVKNIKVKDAKLVKSGEMLRLSGRLQTLGVNEEKCQNLVFIILKNGESIFKGDAEISEVRAKRSKSGKFPKRNMSLELQIDESPDNCDAKFELVPTVSCADGESIEGKPQDISKLVKDVLGCDGATPKVEEPGDGSNNNTIVNRPKKNSSKKSKSIANGVGVETNDLNNNAMNLNLNSEMNNNGVGRNENTEFDVKLQDIYNDGGNFYYIKNIYNIKGDKVEGTKKVSIPSDFMRSLGIKETDFKQDKNGNYRFDLNSRPSKSSRTLLQERLREQVHKQISRAGGDDYNYLYDTRLSPEERKRREKMDFERKKYEAKIKREDRHDDMKMMQLEKQRQEAQAKRENQRDRERMAEDRKYAEMMMRMYDKDAQRRATEGKGKGDSGDKAMMDKMLKILAEQGRAKGEKPVVVKEGKKGEMIPVNMGAPVQPVIMQQPAKSKSKSKDRKKLKRYKKLLRALKRSHKKALAKKSKDGKKPKVSRRMKKLIIREYRERELRSRHSKKSKHGKRKHRKGSRASRHKRREEERRHRRKSRSHGKKAEEKPAKHSKKGKHSKHSKHKKAKVEPEEKKKGKKVKTQKKK